MSTPRLFTETSMVLPNGQFLFMGGKYSDPSYDQNYVNTGEIYNPATNAWTSITPFPESTFGNAPGVVLNDGTVLAGSKTRSEHVHLSPEQRIPGRPAQPSRTATRVGANRGSSCRWQHPVGR